MTSLDRICYWRWWRKFNLRSINLVSHFLLPSTCQHRLCSFLFLCLGSILSSRPTTRFRHGFLCKNSIRYEWIRMCPFGLRVSEPLSCKRALTANHSNIRDLYDPKHLITLQHKVRCPFYCLRACGKDDSVLRPITDSLSPPPFSFDRWPPAASGESAMDYLMRPYALRHFKVCKCLYAKGTVENSR